MIVPITLFYCCLIVVLAYSTSLRESIVLYEPYTLLKPSELLLLLPFDGQNVDVVPSVVYSDSDEAFRYADDNPDGFRNLLCFSFTINVINVNRSIDAVEGQSRFFSSQSAISVPFGVESSSLPSLTVGGWIKFTKSSDNTRRLVDLLSLIIFLIILCILALSFLCLIISIRIISHLGRTCLNQGFAYGILIVATIS